MSKTRSTNLKGATRSSGSSRGARLSKRATFQEVSGSVLFSRVVFLVIVACLVVFGLVMLFSASSIYSYNQTGDYTSVFFRQTIFIAIGALLVLGIAIVPYQKFSAKLCVIALLVCIPLLILVFALGDAALGARRWIDLGFTTLQPSEFAKIALMLVLAHLVDRCRNEGYSRTLIVIMIVACVVPIGLIVIEPDLGTTIISVIGILAVLWFGGVPKRIVGILTISLVIMALLAITGTGFRQTRITSWLDPESDPLGSGYQLLSSYYAFGGGGFFGVGLGLSKQKFNWLPQSENDFIFSIVGEELGFIGALIVVVLFIALVIISLRIAANAPDALGSMIAGSSGVIIGGQAFLNMLCVVGALPTTGKPLPFFSAGGSSIISTMILVGLILSVSLQSSETNVYDFRREQFSVVIGGGQKGAAASAASSVLTRLPNPAALVASMFHKPVAQTRRKAPLSSGKVVPISRGRAERHMRDAQTARQPQTNRRSPTPRQTQSARQVQPARSPQANRQVQVSRQSSSLSRARSARQPQTVRNRTYKQTPHHTASASMQRRAEAPLSMSSLRRNRVKRAGGSGGSSV